MDKVVALLELQKQIRDADRVEDIGFLAANKVHALIPYQQAIFWIKKTDGIELKTLSGTGTLDQNSPYAIWLRSFINKQISRSEDIIEFFGRDSEGEWLSDHNHLVRFKNDQEGLIGGLWIESSSIFSDQQVDLLKEISECFTQALTIAYLRQRSTSFVGAIGLGRYRKWMMWGILILFFLPVRLSITAPAEIVPDNPVSVTMPFDGVLDDIDVDAGDTVTEGQILAQMDQIQLKTDMDRARQALEAARKNLSRAGFESLRTEDKKTDLQKLRSEIEIKEIEYAFAKEKFEKSILMAPSDGVAIFSDKSALMGRPLATGEKIMVIADPKESELLIRIPVHAMLPVRVGQDLSFFTTTSPLSSKAARITSIGYQASADADGLMTYKVRAAIHDPSLRIGWKGTAKIRTDWSILGYALLRRPMIALRNLLGI